MKEIYFMAMAKGKFRVAALVLSLLVISGIAVVGWKLFVESPKAAVDEVTAESQAPAAATANPDARTFEEIYKLPDNVVAERISPPFAKARMDFYWKSNPAQAKAIPRGPDAMLIYSQHGKPQLWGMTFGNGRGYEIQNLIEYVMKIYPQNLAGDTALATLQIKGDIIINRDADPDQVRSALAQTFSEALGFSIVLAPEDVAEKVIVFKGMWQAKSKSKYPQDSIELYGVKREDKRTGGGGSGELADFASWVGMWIKKPVIIEASGLPPFMSWHLNDSSQWTQQERQEAHDPALVCQHIGEQTGMTWSEETRTVSKLYIGNGK
jgi:hypothetical protein